MSNRYSSLNYILFECSDGDLMVLPTSVLTRLGQAAKLTCSTSSKNNINWEFKDRQKQNYTTIFFGGMLVDTYRGRFVVTRESVYTLTVVNVSSSDDGTFKCVDNGGQGPDESEANIIIGESIC